jgi:hypothetical protein
LKKGRRLTGSYRKDASVAGFASVPVPERPFDWFIKGKTR